MQVERDGAYAMVASKGGLPAGDPAWYHNVRAHPESPCGTAPRPGPPSPAKLTGDESGRVFGSAASRPTRRTRLTGKTSGSSPSSCSTTALTRP
ncbi:nitroreductase family deazaflavin-dependent oxidoreductase [Pseudonocardia sp. MCCB 268]|nr:nitroreductase family deazaflavin-dependent oxidoreductase [Pseudonocardia cytotoxica]